MDEADATGRGRGRDGDAAVILDDVARSYGDVVALDGVSLRVPAGEVFGLIGPNGAGKTTLVRAVTGTTDVEGTVRTLGVAPADVDPHRLGLLPQSFSPAARLTPRELVAYYAGLYDADRARDVDAVLADVGLDGDAADRRYEDLSGGQRRRCHVGVALVNDPDLLCLDEPTTGIDPAGRRALWDLVDGLAAGGTTVLLTSHSMPEVERLADRVGLLAGGRLVAVGTPAALVAEHGGDPRLVVGVAGRTARDGADAANGDAGDPRRAAAGALADAGYRVETTGEGVVVREAAPTAVGGAVDALETAGVAYESLVWRQPGLEDVYLRLTGERFEGAGAGAGATRAAGGPVDGASGDDRRERGTVAGGADDGDGVDEAAGAEAGAGTGASESEGEGAGAAEGGRP